MEKPSPRRCTQCAKLFINDETLRAHKKNIHPTTPLVPHACTKYEKKFKRPYDLNRHLRENHKD